MSIERADIVRSIRGRDSGELFFVMTVDENFAYIVNGKDRRIEKPKKKKLKHIEFLESDQGRTAQKIREGDHISNSEIRRALASKTQDLK
jgi:ribosomal protein L14E/L6E/L27E